MIEISHDHRRRRLALCLILGLAWLGGEFLLPRAKPRSAAHHNRPRDFQRHAPQQEARSPD